MLYYTLIPALPWLGALDKLRELPCSTLKLEQRLSMLDDGDREQIARALHLCQRERTGDEAYSDADEIVHWQQELAQIRDPALAKVIGDHLEARTLVAALRYRRAGQGEGGSFQGFGPLVWLIRRNWQLPLFGLEQRFRWLERVNAALQANEIRRLEQLLLERFWQRLLAVEQEQGFSFATVAAYRLRWALAEYRLRWHEEEAQHYFDRLVDGALERSGHPRLPLESTGREV